MEHIYGRPPSLSRQSYVIETADGGEVTLGLLLQRKPDDRPIFLPRVAVVTGHGARAGARIAFRFADESIDEIEVMIALYRRHMGDRVSIDMLHRITDRQWRGPLPKDVEIKTAEGAVPTADATEPEATEGGGDGGA